MYQDDIHIEAVKTCNQIYAEYNKLTIENSLRAIRGLLLAHGGAVTAIIMSQNHNLLHSCLWFGVGAILTVLCSACGYLANLNYMKTWGEFIKNSSVSERDKAQKLGEKCHRYAYFLYIASVCVFFYGLYDVYKMIS